MTHVISAPRVPYHKDRSIVDVVKPVKGCSDRTKEVLGIIKVRSNCPFEKEGRVMIAITKALGLVTIVFHPEDK